MCVEKDGFTYAHDKKVKGGGSSYAGQPKRVWSMVTQHAPKVNLRGYVKGHENIRFWTEKLSKV